MRTLQTAGNFARKTWKSAALDEDFNFGRTLRWQASTRESSLQVQLPRYWDKIRKTDEPKIGIASKLKFTSGNIQQ